MQRVYAASREKDGWSPIGWHTACRVSTRDVCPTMTPIPHLNPLSQILFLNAQILECANKVPSIVLNGSHQIAAAWKEVAESVFKRDLSGAPGSMTAEALGERLAEKVQLLKKLKGDGLLT